MTLLDGQGTPYDVGEGSAKESKVARDVAQFLLSLREKNASPHTIKAYKTNLDQFADYLDAPTCTGGPVQSA